VTTALGSSRLWATIGRGIVNEVYWPLRASRRSAIWGSIWSQRPLDRSEAGAPLPAAHAGPRPPGAHHRCITAMTISSPSSCCLIRLRDVLLMRFALHGSYRLVLILAPHLGSNRP